MTTPMAEFAAKQARLGAWLAERSADAALLCAAPNVAWLASGGELWRCDAQVGFVVTPVHTYLLAPADDVERVRQEEVRGFAVEMVTLAGSGSDVLVAQARALLPATTRWRCDVPGLGFETDASVAALRRSLGPEEVERLRRLGHDATAAVEEVAAECFRGILERDAAARLAAECLRRQIAPRAILAGADDRSHAYPRPLPKAASAEGSLVLGLIGVRAGLHVALSRTICLTRPAPEFLARHERAAEFMARLRHATQVGSRLGEVVRRAALPPDAHVGSLGGLAGYELPDIEARTDSTWTLDAGHSLVWRVASPGARCEDTFWIDAGGSELLTASEDWPRRIVHVGGTAYEVPDLLLL
jgi:Xaa-Pro aminopeptidase